MEYIFIDAGIIDGIQYVDVLTRDGGDPMQYGLPLDEAIRDYGQNKMMTMKEYTGTAELEECSTCHHPLWEHLNTQGCHHLTLGAISHRFCECETFLRQR